jgi:hypothetical protein
MGNVKFALDKTCWGVSRRQNRADGWRGSWQQNQRGNSGHGVERRACATLPNATRLAAWQSECLVAVGGARCTSPLDWALASAPTIGSGGVPREPGGPHCKGHEMKGRSQS